MAVAAAAIWMHGAHMLSAWAAVASAYTALCCLGPRSRPARRELNRVLNAFASSPLAAAVTMLTLGMVAMIIGVLAVVKPPPMWPMPDLPSMLIHLPDHKAVSLRR